MKKILLLSLCSLALALIACQGGEERKVKKVATQYLTHFKNLEFDKAKELGTPGAVDFLEQMDKYIKSLSEGKAAQRRNALSKADVSIKHVKLMGKKAEVRYQFVEKGRKHNVETLYLQKSADDRWLVDEVMPL